eukprot:scaffold69718_cov27-Tisochrysis_lutea.AAC.5
MSQCDLVHFCGSKTPSRFACFGSMRGEPLQARHHNTLRGLARHRVQLIHPKVRLCNRAHIVTSEKHARALGLSLGASEAWADRLYIEDRNGILLFDEAELNRVEEAQVFTHERAPPDLSRWVRERFGTASAL